MRGVLAGLAEDLRLRGRFHLEEAFIDGSFAPAKKGDAGVGKTYEVFRAMFWLRHPLHGPTS
jgi:hypothetical protein